MMADGQISRAMNRITSFGIADIEDPSIRTQIEKKFPPKTHDLPAFVSKTTPIERFKDLRRSLLSLEPGKAPGCGGLRPEYLMVLGEAMDGEEISLLEQFGLKYLSGELPEWFYKLWLSLQTRQRREMTLGPSELETV